MNSSVYFILVSLWTLLYASEPECPRYFYEEKTLEKIIKTEFIVEKLKSELEGNDGTTKVELGKMRSDLDKIERDIIEMKEKYEESVANLKRVKDDAEGTPVVAFRVSQLKDLQPNNGDTIIFTTTHFDKGSGYDNMTGVYTAPYSGVYMFTCQLCVKKSKNVGINFVQGTTTANTFWTDGGQMTGACRKMVNVLMLDANEQVRAKISYKSTGENFWQNSSGKNMYSGVLIQDLS